MAKAPKNPDTVVEDVTPEPVADVVAEGVVPTAETLTDALPSIHETMAKLKVSAAKVKVTPAAEPAKKFETVVHQNGSTVTTF